MLKVAIVGCGKIADAHAHQIGRIDGCRIVGVCDREPLMAKQLFDRFPIDQHFTDLGEMLATSKPDVVHVTTPPASHFDIARVCLEAGSHVYVEKPFTLTLHEAERLVALANQRDRKLTVGHDDQYSHVARRMRSLIQKGYLGGETVHMESYYGYELAGGYARALLGDKDHWVRKLPGQLLHNIISHAVARIAEHLKTDSPRVIAHGFVSPFLRSFGESGIVDELRVIISEEGGRTAYLTFSTQMRPSIHEFRIFGTKNGLVLDQDHEILLKLRGQRYVSYADKFIPPVLFAKQHVGNLVSNLKTFLRNDFHMKSGMKYLIQGFYQSIVEGTPLPISYREILLTARIIESIFDQIYRPAGVTLEEAVR